MMIKPISFSALAFVLSMFCGAAAVNAASSPSFGASLPAISSPQYTVTDLGSVGVVTQLGYTPGLSLNEKGDVAWYIEDAKQAFLWTKGKKVSLGNMDRVTVRDDGTVVGLRVLDPAHVGYNQTMYHTVLWDNGHVTDLDPSGVLVGQDLAMSATGSVVGSINAADKGDAHMHTPPGSHAALWKGGKLTDLETMGGRFGVATALNGKGQVVGFSAPAGVHEQHGFLWNKGKFRDLGRLPGFLDYAPNAINDHGQVVGWAFSFDDIKAHAGTGPDHAFLWEKGRMQDLGTLGGHDSRAYAINNAGAVVGTSDTGQGGAAFLYQSGRMVDLNMLVPAVGNVPLAIALSRHLSVALAINDGGQIVALGNQVNNKTHVFLLTPTTSVTKATPKMDQDQSDCGTSKKTRLGAVSGEHAQ